MHKNGFLALPAIFLLGLLPVLAQVETANITGTVRDSTGAVIPGVDITVTHVQTNQEARAVTGEAGRYVSPPLRPGDYTVAAELPGFKRIVRSGIRLQVQQTAVIDFVLEVGEMTEQVEVVADAALLNTTDASRGEVIDNQKIVELPLNTRDYLQLALLTAGSNVPPPGSRFGGFSSSGMRVSHNNYLLDGMDNNSNQHAAQSRTGEVISPSIDAIREFKVLTTNYSAEYGRNVGGVVNVVMKSGTNEFHGGIYEFLRNDVLDARNFFDDPDEPIPPYRRNQFGGTLGGPVFQDKTFFFFDYEGTRLRQSRTVLSTIPTEAERKGDFSQSIFNRTPVEIFDPATYDPPTKTRQPFPNNIIPENRLDPAALQVASFYPLPNRPGDINNFLSNPLNQENTDKFDVRIDHSFGASDTLFGRFSFLNYEQLPEGNLPTAEFPRGTDAIDAENQARSFVLSYSHIFSPTLFITSKLGYNRLLTERTSPIEEDLNQRIGLTGTPQIPGLASFGISGFRGLGFANTPHLADSQTRQIVNDLTWVKGKHSLKTGINFFFIQAPHTQVYQSHGVFSFNGNFTRQTSPFSGGHPLADMLLGIPATTQLATIARGNQRRRLYHGYIQDEIKATANLTLSMGVRYEYIGPWFEKYNHYSNFDIDTDPVNPRLLLATDGGISERSTLDPDYNNFAPRLGIAYRLAERTVIRSGYGIYYGGVTHIGDRYLHASPPFFFQARITTDSIQPTVVLADGVPPLTDFVSNLQTISQDRRNRNPYSQHWNLTIQHELRNDLMFEVAYAATKGAKLIRRFDTNAPDPGPGNINRRRPVTQLEVPGLDYIVTPLADTFRREWSANSNYHSMQTKIEKRFSAGLSFLGSYTWSKTISDSRGGADAGGTAPVGVQDRKNLRAERSVADEHIPHRFVFTANYDLPLGRGRAFMSGAHPVLNAIFGGWAIAGITTFQSGRPENIEVTRDPANNGGSAPDRPNRLSDPELPGHERTLDRWFDTEAFVANDPFTFGNSSRNPIQIPDFRNVDLAVYKLFRPTEGTAVQFRAEFFNATNRPHFGSPGSTVGTGQFGVISSAGAARIIQFGLKINF
ncbi:MAG: TonB-dependent receptor [Acidobacteriota bacterium]